MERKKFFTLAISIVFILILATMPVLTACSNDEEPASSSTTTTEQPSSTTTTETPTGTTTETTTETPAETTTTTTSEPGIIRIGLPISLTGWISAQDIVQCEETKIACDLINEAGGITIDGQQYMIELVVEDIKSNFDGTAAALNKLIYDEEVDFICGCDAFFNSVASPICNQNQILQGAVYSVMQPGEVDASTPYTFLCSNSFVGRSMASIQALKYYYPEVEQVAVVIVDDGGIPYITPIVETFLDAQGVSIAGGEIIGFPNEMQDFSPIAAKLNAIEDAGAVLQITGIISHVGSIVKGYGELGNEDVPYMTALLANCADIYKVAGEAARDGVFTNAATPGDPENPEMMQELIERLQAKLGDDTAIYLEYANALVVLANAIEASQSLDSTEIKDYWENEITTLDTLFGEGRMGGEQMHGIANHAMAHPMCMQMMKDGEQVSAGWFDIGQIP